MKRVYSLQSKNDTALVLKKNNINSEFDILTNYFNTDVANLIIQYQVDRDLSGYLIKTIEINSTNIVNTFGICNDKIYLIDYRHKIITHDLTNNLIKNTILSRKNVYNPVRLLISELSNNMYVVTKYEVLIFDKYSKRFLRKLIDKKKYRNVDYELSSIMLSCDEKTIYVFDNLNKYMYVYNTISGNFLYQWNIEDDFDKYYYFDRITLYKDEIYVLNADKYVMYVYNAFGDLLHQYKLSKLIELQFLNNYNILFRIHNDKIYLYNNKHIYVFQLDGTFIKKLKMEYNNNYLSPTSMIINNNRLYILSIYIGDDGCPAQCPVEELFIFVVD